MSDIDEVISSSLEFKRATAVKMYLKGYSYSQISDILNVSQFFVEKWRAMYNKKGADCFKVGYKGSEGFLTENQLKDIDMFIKTKQTCQLEELISYIQNSFGIEYKSKQSYYNLLDKAGMSWKKTEKVNPKKDAEKIIAKKEELKKNSMLEKKRFLLGNWSF